MLSATHIRCLAGVLCLLITACGQDAATPSRPPPIADAPSAVTAAPSLMEAANIAYTGLDEPVTLVDGLWEGDPFLEGGVSRPEVGLVDDFEHIADLDGDGQPETVVWLWTSSGGSGVFLYMAVLDRTAAGVVHNVATTLLGNRVQLRSVSSNANRIILDTVEAGPDDAMCCGAQRLRRYFDLTGTMLSEHSVEDQGRLGILDLEGNWRLQRFDVGAPVLEGIPEITLTGRSGEISGSNGCNAYRGRFSRGDVDGELKLDMPLISTRKACDGEADERERRFMAAMESVSGLFYLRGQLALRYGSDGQSLIFERVADEG